MTKRQIHGLFKIIPQAQRFLSVHDKIANIFHPKHYHLSNASYRRAWTDDFSLWLTMLLRLQA
jgi:putative transposase